MEQRTAHVWRAGLSASLLGGVLGSPIVWAIHLQLVYTLVKHAQRSHRYTALHLTTAVCLLLVLGFGLLSYADWRRTGDAPLDKTNDGRCRFMALLGMLLSGLFALVILATGIAPFYFDAAWD